MKYSVFWSRLAESQLARLWTAADDRNAIASAANSIDRLLQSTPDTVGESRADGARILIVKPLG